MKRESKLCCLLAIAMIGAATLALSVRLPQAHRVSNEAAGLAHSLHHARNFAGIFPRGL
jgi:hypothetical protein